MTHITPHRHLTKAEPKCGSSVWKSKKNTSTSHDSKAVRSILAAIIWSICFLHDFITLTHCCGGILARSSWQCSFSSLTVAGIHICTTLLRSHRSISVRLFSVVDLLVFSRSLPCCMTQFFPTFAVRQMWHCNTLVNRGVRRWLSDCKESKSCGCRIGLNHPSSTLLDSGGVYTDLLCLVSSKHCPVYYG